MKQPKFCMPLLYTSAILLSLQGCAQNNAKPTSAAFSNKSFESLQALSDDDAGRDDTNVHASLWQRLFDMYALPTFEHEAIDREVVWFVNHPEYIQRVQERAGPFLHTILEQMDQEQVPGEIALLPVIESAFRPEANSPKAAAGLWQFIPSTGRLFGLKQNQWYDGRRDVHESTHAAIQYLKKLHGDFDGDWLLALAAYNAGEGTVSRAIKRNQDANKPTDFWSLNLPQETKTYVPRLLAVARVFANADDYALNLRELPNKAVLEPIQVGPRANLKKLADMVNMSVEELHALNPGFHHGSTGPETQTLLIPVDRSDTFKDQLAKLDWNEVAQEESTASPPDDANAFHLVRRGESLAQIARQHGISEPAIRRANHLASGKLRSGTSLLIPTSEKAVRQETLREYGREIAAATVTPPGKNERRQSYAVRKGDSLQSVARHFGVSVDQVKHWNSLKKGEDKLAPGKQLAIWTKAADSQTVEAKPERLNVKSSYAPVAASPAAAKRSAGKQAVLYTVRGGDTLAAIARRFSVSVDDLKKWNIASVAAKGLQPGTVLTIRKG